MDVERQCAVYDDLWLKPVSYVAGRVVSVYRRPWNGCERNTAEKLANRAMTGSAMRPPVAFVGGRAVDRLRHVSARARTSRDRTIVIQGVPGAHKTALLGEIERRLPTVVPDGRAI